MLTGLYSLWLTYANNRHANCAGSVSVRHGWIMFCVMTDSTIAIRAANNTHIWGRQAALTYVIRNGVNPRLYYLARMLRAAQSIERE